MAQAGSRTFLDDESIKQHDATNIEERDLRDSRAHTFQDRLLERPAKRLAGACFA